jgi:hypothetical protein
VTQLDDYGNVTSGAPINATMYGTDHGQLYQFTAVYMQFTTQFGSVVAPIVATHLVFAFDQPTETVGVPGDMTITAVNGSGGPGRRYERGRRKHPIPDRRGP